MDLPQRIGTTSLSIMEANQSFFEELNERGACFGMSGSSLEEVQGTDGAIHVLESRDTRADMALILILRVACIVLT